MSIVTKGKGAKYISVKCPPEFISMANTVGRVPEHQLLMAIKIGRPLTPDEVVHHIDCCGLNNEINNLLLIECSGDHTALHGHRWIDGKLEPWWLKPRPSHAIKTRMMAFDEFVKKHGGGE